MLDRSKETTQGKIINTFLDFYRQKPIELITIKAIAETCHINRGTFYLHYLDLDDLLTSIEDEQLQIIRNINRECSHFYQSNDLHVLNSYFTPLLSHIYENGKVIDALLGSHSRPRFRMLFKDILKKNVVKRLKRLPDAKDGDKEKNDYMREMILDSIAFGQVEIIRCWINIADIRFVEDVSGLMSSLLLNSPFVGRD